MALLPFMSSGLTNAAAGASEDAALTGTPPVAQGPESTAQLMKLLGGDLSGSLTGGDKLLALAALMRSATRSGRRAGLTPQQVMGQLQQQKVAEVQNRLTVEQLRADKAQRQQQVQMVNEYAGALEDPQQRAALMALGPAEAAKKISEVAFRQRQVQQIVTDEKGETRLVFGDGTTGSLDFKLERGAKWIKGDPMNTGTQVLVKVDEKTGEPIKEDGKFVTMAVGTSWADQKRIANETERVRLARDNASRAGGGGGKRNAPAEIYDLSGNRVLAEYDTGSREYYVPGTMTVIKRGVTPSGSELERAIRAAGGGRGPLLDPGGS